ncbi:MAG TPA: ubiquinol-cytochrome C chaperone family protein [Allosphingosinicella sp.]|jgi:cytochrome b pre-mRNA-processing protein 3
MNRASLRGLSREFCAVSILQRLFGGSQAQGDLRPLYEAAVAEGRDPAWYLAGGVPDTIDGRFDVIASVVSLILLRFEADGDAARTHGVMLTERFIEDMDGQLREIGIGDVVVGKHMGKMMGALGGRLGAYRSGLAGEGDAGEGDLHAAVRRNIFRDAAPSEEAVAFVADRLRRLHEALAATPLEQLLRAELPRP